MASGARDRILDALQEILVRDGIAAVTLESVAAAAGVSKGGLLYHFGSKAALLNGLIERMTASIDAEVSAAEHAPGGIPRWYLETSTPESEQDRQLWRAMLAALRSNDGSLGEVGDRVRDLFDHCSVRLYDVLDDPVQAELVRTVGDGLYLRALLGSPPPDRAVLDQMFELLLTARAGNTRSA
jgi:AcrR family transcriptional regulator